MTLTAYAPNGKRITHEYWGRPYVAEATFERKTKPQPEDDRVAPDVVVSMDYDANVEQDDVMYRRDQGGRALRWMCEGGELWGDDDLTFQEDSA